MGMIGSTLALLAGVLGVMVYSDSELLPLAWFFVVIGGVSMVANLALRKRTL